MKHIALYLSYLHSQSKKMNCITADHTLTF